MSTRSASRRKREPEIKKLAEYTTNQQKGKKKKLKRQTTPQVSVKSPRMCKPSQNIAEKNSSSSSSSQTEYAETKSGKSKKRASEKEQPENKPTKLQKTQDSTDAMLKPMDSDGLEQGESVEGVLTSLTAENRNICSNSGDTAPGVNSLGGDLLSKAEADTSSSSSASFSPSLSSSDKPINKKDVVLLVGAGINNMVLALRLIERNQFFQMFEASSEGLGRRATMNSAGFIANENVIHAFGKDILKRSDREWKRLINNTKYDLKKASITTVSLAQHTSYKTKPEVKENLETEYSWIKPVKSRGGFQESDGSNLQLHTPTIVHKLEKYIRNAEKQGKCEIYLGATVKKFLWNKDNDVVGILVGNKMKTFYGREVVLATGVFGNHFLEEVVDKYEELRDVVDEISVFGQLAVKCEKDITEETKDKKRSGALFMESQMTLPQVGIHSKSISETITKKIAPRHSRLPTKREIKKNDAYTWSREIYHRQTVIENEFSCEEKRFATFIEYTAFKGDQSILDPGNECVPTQVHRRIVPLMEAINRSSIYSTFTHTGGGWMPVTPRIMPALGRLIPGVIVGIGGGCWGITVGPVMALVNDMILAGKSATEICAELNWEMQYYEQFLTGSEQYLKTCGVKSGEDEASSKENEKGGGRRSGEAEKSKSAPASRSKLRRSGRIAKKRV